MRSRNIKYIPAVDQLRGFAALLIVFYHGYHVISYHLLYGEPFKPNKWPEATNPLHAFLIEGHTAVAMFMVLSGFIFTIGSFGKHVNSKRFFQNRFLRTYPLFLFVLMAGTIAAPENISLNGILKTVFFMANTNGAFHSGPFTAMFWTVTVEWHFYLAFPLLLTLTNIAKTKFLFCLIITLVLIRLIIISYGASLTNPRDLSYWTIFGRMDQFALGMASGLFYIKYFHKNLFFDVLAIIFFILICVYLYCLNMSGGWPTDYWWKVLTPTVEGFLWGGFIIGFLSFSRRIPFRIGLLFRQTGIISYSIYLIHFVVLTYVIKLNWIPSVSNSNVYFNAIVTTALIVLPLTLLVSTFTFTFIEAPFLKKRNTYNQKLWGSNT